MAHLLEDTIAIVRQLAEPATSVRALVERTGRQLRGMNLIDGLLVVWRKPDGTSRTYTYQLSAPMAEDWNNTVRNNPHALSALASSPGYVNSTHQLRDSLMHAVTFQIVDGVVECEMVFVRGTFPFGDQDIYQLANVASHLGEYAPKAQECGALNDLNATDKETLCALISGEWNVKTVETRLQISKSAAYQRTTRLVKSVSKGLGKQLRNKDELSRLLAKIPAPIIQQTCQGINQ